MSRARSLVPFALALLFAIPTTAQGPAANWRTLKTAHFRVHYPAASEVWARRAAARLESIRERVAAEVGYAPPEVVDVVVSDPVAEPNGAALPFLGWPRLILWTSPPGPESVLGQYRDWGELLIVHEEAHLAHLLRPSRNPLRRGLEHIVPAGPVATKSPRWVTEGYATVVEGRLTASGRPNGDLRAAILRRWAQAGKLPGYGRLAADRESWQGMSMAYLAGSAYLEWLEERAGPGSLKKLWARMSARAGRSFDDAFAGVFGDSPADLYDRFRAVLTGRALEVERRVEPGLRQGALWQDLSWSPGAPALSPTGDRLAIVLRHKEDPAELVVWSTGPNDEAEAKWEKERAELLARDPEDVAAVRTKPLPREPLHRLPERDGVEPAMPRFLPDGGSLLFVRFEPDGEGFLHPDLFRWTLESGEVRRLTHGADLRDPDPAPDGAWAVAVRNRDGGSQVVRVELATGEVTALTEPSAEVTYDHPRVAPDGRRIAYARHREGSWALVVQDLETGDELVLAPPPGGTVASPAWSPDGRTLYAVVGQGGFIDVAAFPVGAGATPVPVTRVQGAAFAPAPTPDGKALFYLTLEPDGLDLARLELAPATAAELRPIPPLPDARGLAPAVRPPAPAEPEPFAAADLPPGRPYGLGRQEALALVGGIASSAGGALELGARWGDPIGRLDLLILGAAGAIGPEGGALAGTWRGGPDDLSLHLFAARERPGRQDDPPPGLGGTLDLDRRGVELAAVRDRSYGPDWLHLAGRGLWQRIEETAGDDGGGLAQEIAALEAAYRARRSRGDWHLDPDLSLHLEAGRTGRESWRRYGGRLGLGLGHDETRLRFAWQRDGSRDLHRAFDLYQLGGAAGSLLPESALASRIELPALPAGTLLGDEHEAERAELDLDAFPAPLFYERHRLWRHGDPRGEWFALYGLEWRFRLAPLPLGRLPALDARLGIAQVLDPPYEDDLRWWLGLTWRP